MKPKDLSAKIRNFLTLVTIILLSIVLFDFVLFKFGLFPSKKPVGDKFAGFVSPEKNLNKAKEIPRKPSRNSSGFLTVRPVEEILSSPRTVTIAMVGDSHSDLGEFVKPEDLHSFVCERELQTKGFDVEMLSAGIGKYSPLQEYLYYKHYLKNGFNPKILLMNVYTGNDWYDMLRVDDRPHFQDEVDGTVGIAGPVWCFYRNPDGGTWVEESRVLELLDNFSRLFTGSQIPIYTRLKFLMRNARTEHGGVRDVVGYINDIRLSLEPRLRTPQAFSAQILNQAIFFRHFPNGIDRSNRYIKQLLHLIHAEDPNIKVVVCAIPSAALAQRLPDEKLFLSVLDRISMRYEDVIKLEKGFYDNLRKDVQDEGFIFVDLLHDFINMDNKIPLYDGRDLHINKKACDIIGQKQANIIIESGLIDP